MCLTLNRLFPGAQEHQSGRADPRLVRGERSATEGSGGGRAAAQIGGEDQATGRGRHLDAPHERMWSKPPASPLAILQL